MTSVENIRGPRVLRTPGEERLTEPAREAGELPGPRGGSRHRRTSPGRRRPRRLLGRAPGPARRGARADVPERLPAHGRRAGAPPDSGLAPVGIDGRISADPVTGGAAERSEESAE
ncbi:hypothetical protein [Streptomyces sp. NPDC014734]|uniref:hypothetical protein n=1 Tax=Streptomyces sp. NPDC014734 TaxID=3364886 RepID=UPI0036FA6BE0